MPVICSQWRCNPCLSQGIAGLFTFLVPKPRYMHLLFSYPIYMVKLCQKPQIPAGDPLPQSVTPRHCRDNAEVKTPHLSWEMPPLSLAPRGDRCSIMHQSFVTPAPPGPGNSGAFNFSLFKARLKARHCRARFVVKSLLKAPAPWMLTITWNDSWELF